MRFLRQAILLLLLGLIVPQCPAWAAEGKWAKLEDCTLGDGYMDADSFHIRHQNKDYIIRLYFVDAFEANDEFPDRNEAQAEYFNIPLKKVIPLANKGTKFVQRILSGRKFTVYTRWTDAMGSSSQPRYFGLIRVGKQDLGEALVEYGLARVYGASTMLPDGTSADAEFQRLRHLEKRAKAKKFGGWSKSQTVSEDGGLFSEEDIQAIDQEIEEIEPYNPTEGAIINVPAVAFLRAETFVNTGRYEDAEIEMRRLLQRFPNHLQKARIEFYRALATAMQERFEEAINLFQQWLKDWPRHIMVADVKYWMPIAMYYDGQYERAMPYLEEYAETYPMSIYAPEAAYRATCCKYALEQYDMVAEETAAWLEQYPDHYFQYEVSIMRGDALAAIGELDDALVAYQRAFTPEAKGFYYMALTQAARVYKAFNEEARYYDMARAYLSYIKNCPNDSNIADAAWQAGWAYKQVKQVDMARNLYWQMIERYGNTIAWEGFDMMLKDLVTMYPRNSDEYVTKLKEQTSKAIEAKRLTLAARLQLAEISLQSPEMQARYLHIFTTRYKSEVMSPEVLAWVGRMWIEQKSPDTGMPYLDLLISKFPESRYLSVAYALMAGQAIQAKDYSKALSHVNFVLESAAEVSTMMEATFLRAEALRGLGQYAPAIEDYKMTLAAKGVPRQYKPLSLLGIGDCLVAQKDYNQAIAFYQRIYVLYGAFQDEVIQAYLRSAQCFAQLGDKQSAIRTYQEMLELEYIHGRSEAAEARSQLTRLGGTAP